jgi:hypothetical protein
MLVILACSDLGSEKHDPGGTSQSDQAAWVIGMIGETSHQ